MAEAIDCLFAQFYGVSYHWQSWSLSSHPANDACAWSSVALPQAIDKPALMSPIVLEVIEKLVHFKLAYQILNDRTQGICITAQGLMPLLIINYK